jgi:hypothetical protein
MNADRLVRHHPLQVHMQHLVLRRVQLDILHDGLLVLAIQLQRDDARIELLVPDHVEQLELVQREVRGLAIATIQDGRHLARATQAAARTLALVVARLGANFK